MEKKGTVLMHRFELGRLLGRGTFAKVYHLRNLTTGQSCAIKIIDKEKIMKGGLTDQIKREISVMRLVKHPNVVRLYEVASPRYILSWNMLEEMSFSARLPKGNSMKMQPDTISSN